MTRLAIRALAYLALAVGLTWPAAIHPVAAVPGGPRTDLWEGLWSLWFVARRLVEGGPFTRVDGLLDHPDGGSLWVADPVNALLGAPLVLAVGPAAAWSVLVIAHLTFAGLAAHALGEKVGGRPGAGWIAGVAVAAAPMGLAAVHNGATEAVGGGWVVLAALAVWRLREAPTARAAVLTGLALGVASVAHFYGGVQVYLLWGVALLDAGRRRSGVVAFLGAGALGLALAGPVAAGAESVSRAPDSVVGIKSPRELATLRRTIGPADPRGFVMPGDFRSPDFSLLSRYQERYVHCTYLGWVLLVGGLVGLGRREGGRHPAASTPTARSGRWVFAVAGLAGLVLSMGPVLVADGAPVILPGRLGIPLPYFLLEGLPGFGSLSLLYRLAFLPVVVLAALAARGLSGRAAPLVVVALLAETLYVSPARALPEHVDGRAPAPLTALRDAPEEGAVMNWPVVGGRAYLYEQTTHGRPLAATLNFPSNGPARKVWKVAIDHAGDAPEALAAKVAGRARAEGIRWLVLHDDPSAEPDVHDAAARALAGAVPTLAEGEGLRVLKLY